MTEAEALEIEMAFVTFNATAGAVQMTVPNLVAFDNVSTAAPTAYSWETPSGHEVDLFGSGFTFDASGRVTGGRATSAQIDIGDNGLNDIQITGINIPADILDDSAEQFWSATLSGTTIINAQALSKEAVPFGSAAFIFGDDLKAATGSNPAALTEVGGNDVITLGTGSAFAVGDVDTVEGVFDTANPLFAVYDAGDDQLLAPTTDRDQTLVGDAFIVRVNARLLGGDDLLSFASTNAASEMIGDVFSASGSLVDRSLVDGGNDRLEAKAGNLASMTGDVFDLQNGVDVVGGNDTITGADQGEVMSGDVSQDRSTGGATIVGGRDLINGGGGNDTIAGDVLFDSASGFVTGGADVVRGGDGDDAIFGEVGRAAFNTVLAGGNDRLFGDAGDDTLSGQTGNDRLNGGDGDDALNGGSGRDRLAGGRGDDALKGGAGTDTFIFARNGDGDRVTDFANGVDVLDLQSFGFGSFADAHSLATEAGGDLRLAFGGGDVLIIEDFSLAEFTAGDVIL